MDLLIFMSHTYTQICRQQRDHTADVWINRTQIAYKLSAQSRQLIRRRRLLHRLINQHFLASRSHIHTNDRTHKCAQEQQQVGLCWFLTNAQLIRLTINRTLLIAHTHMIMMIINIGLNLATQICTKFTNYLTMFFLACWIGSLSVVFAHIDTLERTLYGHLEGKYDNPSSPSHTSVVLLAIWRRLRYTDSNLLYVSTDNNFIDWPVAPISCAADNRYFQRLIVNNKLIW